MITLGCDVSDIILQRTLQYNTEGLSQSINQMSTGYKLNHAKDNAAGYSIARDLSVKISSMLQVQQNTEDGFAMLQTAEGGLDEINSLLQRLRSLAMQAANGNYGAESRASMQQEADEIIEEIERLRDSMEYNGMKLYETPQDNNVVTTAINNLQRARVSINGEAVSQTLNSTASNLVDLSTPLTLSNYSSNEQSAPLSEPLTTSTFTPAVSPLAAGDIEGAVDIAGGATKTVVIDGVEYSVKNKLTTSQTLSYTKDTSSGEVTIMGSSFEITAQKNAAHNLVINGGSNTIYLGDLNDSITILGGFRGNYVYAGAGEDSILSRGEWGNYFYGEDGNDTFTLYNGGQYAYGGEGDDVFYMNSLNQESYGEAGNDKFYIKATGLADGGDGDDYFEVASGVASAKVYGGAGNNSITDNGTNTIKTDVPGANAYQLAFNGNETKVVQINGIEYSITEKRGQSASLIYSVDSSGVITFTSSDRFTVVGEQNKVHNVVFNLGSSVFMVAI